MNGTTITIKDKTNNVWKTKSLTIHDLGDRHQITNYIVYLFQTLTENKGLSEVTITFKIPRREI